MLVLMDIFLFLLSLSYFRIVSAAGKTHIYIDQIPLYTSLQPCAQDRLSAIVRAQVSGCGDDTQLTSFACFCIDSSSEFSSIVSTAVQEDCGRRPSTTRNVARSVIATTTTTAGRIRDIAGRVRARQATSTTAAPTPTGRGAADVRSALEVFASYCRKSTELSRFNQVPTVTITEALKTITMTPTSIPNNSSQSSTPLATIVVPSIIIPLAVAVAIVYFLHRRRVRAMHSQLHSYSPSHGANPSWFSRHIFGTSRRAELDPQDPRYGEMFNNGAGRVEIASSESGMGGRKVHEMGAPAVELEGGQGGVWGQKQQIDKEKKSQT